MGLGDARHLCTEIGSRDETLHDWHQSTNHPDPLHAIYTRLLTAFFILLGCLCDYVDSMQAPLELVVEEGVN